MIAPNEAVAVKRWVWKSCPVPDHLPDCEAVRAKFYEPPELSTSTAFAFGSGKSAVALVTFAQNDLLGEHCVLISDEAVFRVKSRCLLEFEAPRKKSLLQAIDDIYGVGQTLRRMGARTEFTRKLQVYQDGGGVIATATESRELGDRILDIELKNGRKAKVRRADNGSAIVQDEITIMYLRQPWKDSETRLDAKLLSFSFMPLGEEEMLLYQLLLFVEHVWSA